MNLVKERREEDDGSGGKTELDISERLEKNIELDIEHRHARAMSTLSSS